MSPQKPIEDPTAPLQLHFEVNDDDSHADVDDVVEIHPATDPHVATDVHAATDAPEDVDLTVHDVHPKVDAPEDADDVQDVDVHLADVDLIVNSLLEVVDSHPPKPNLVPPKPGDQHLLEVLQ